MNSTADYIAMSCNEQLKKAITQLSGKTQKELYCTVRKEVKNIKTESGLKWDWKGDTHQLFFLFCSVEQQHAEKPKLNPKYLQLLLPNPI